MINRLHLSAAVSLVPILGLMTPAARAAFDPLFTGPTATYSVSPLTDYIGYSLSTTTPAYYQELTANGVGINTYSYYTGNVIAGKGNRAGLLTPTGFTGLGVLGQTSTGVSGAAGYAVNNSGVAAGLSNIYSGDASLGFVAVVWNNSTTPTPLDVSAYGAASNGQSASRAYLLNDSGTSVGYASNYDASHTYIGQAAVRWSLTGVATPLATLRSGGTAATAGYSQPSGFNNNNIVVGQSVLLNSGGGAIERAAVRWAADGSVTRMADIGVNSAGYAFSMPDSLNDAGIAVGQGNYGNGTRATRWAADGSVTKLGLLGTFDDSTTGSSNAYYINAGGTAFGYASKILSTANSSGTLLATRWEANSSTAVELGNLGVVNASTTANSYSSTSTAYSANDLGVAVGTCAATISGTTVTNHPVFWLPDGTAVDMTTLADPALTSGISLRSAYSISSKGWVSGYGLKNGSDQTTFLMQLAPFAAYFTGSQDSTLSTVTGASTNFSYDAAGTSTTNLLPAGYSDVYFAAANVNAANVNTVLGADTVFNSVTFNAGATPMTIGGTNTLTINARGIAYAAGTGIVVANGAAASTISANIALATSQSWTSNASTPFTVSGSVALGGNTLTLAGSGTQLISGAVTGSGGISDLAAGTVVLSGANTYTGVTAVNNAAATLQVNIAARNPLLTNAGGADIANGKVVFTYTGTSPAATIRSLLTTSHANGFTTGQLRSSTATATRGLGYADNGSGTVTVKATLYGDADLDGGVSINDFNLLAANFGKTTKVWADGDFDYDGGVSINDFNLLAANFGKTLSSSADGPNAAALGLWNFAVAHDDQAAFIAATGVPEPTALALLAVSACAGLRRRRR